MSLFFAIQKRRQRDTKRESNSLIRASPMSASNRQWCLCGIRIILLVRLVALVSNRSLTLPPGQGIPLFHGPWCAPVHEVLLGNFDSMCGQEENEPFIWNERSK